MKRLSFILIQVILSMTCIWLTACSDDDNKVTVNFEVSPENLSFEARIAEEAIRVVASGNWTAQSNAEWCKLSATSGTDAAIIKVTVEENKTAENRETTIDVQLGGEKKTIHVIQMMPDNVSFSVTQLNFSSHEESMKVNLTAARNWTVKQPLPSWLKVTPLSGNKGTAELTVSVDEYDRDIERVDSVVVTLEGSTRTASLKVNQLGIFGTLTERDSVALAAFFKCIDPDCALGIWNTNTSYRNWKGVSTSLINGVRRVTNLNGKLIHAGLDYTPWERDEHGDPVPFPEEFGYLTELTSLSFADMLLQFEIPAVIGKLVQLQNLDLSNNRFTGGIPESYKALVNLQTLDFSDNDLSGDIPDFIGDFVHLTSLNLGYNNFRTIPDVFARMTELETLNISSLFEVLEGGLISYPDVQRRFPSTLLRLTKLRELRMNTANFSGELPNFSGMTALELLMAYDNNFTGSIPDFSSLKNIVSINLSGNKLTGGIPASFGNCSYLANLILSNNPNLGGELPKELGNCINLMALEASNCGLTGTIDPLVFGNSRLVNLNLSKNSFSGTFPNTIGNHSALETVNIFENKFTEIESGFSLAVKITTFNASNNELTSISPDFGKLPLLMVLDLSYNNITGQFPVFFKDNSMLEMLFLYYNKLSGDIPEEVLQNPMYKKWGWENFICPQQDGVTLPVPPGLVQPDPTPSPVRN